MMVCVRVVGLRVPSSCCGSPWPPHRLSSLGQLLRTCSRSHSIPIGSPFPPSQKNKMLHADCGADLKNKKSRSGRVQSVSSPPLDGQSPSSFVVESSLLPAQFPPRKPRLGRSVTRGGACLCARAFRVSIAAPPLLPKRRANRRWPCLTHYVRPNSTATPKPRGHTQQQECMTP